MLNNEKVVNLNFKIFTSEDFTLENQERVQPKPSTNNEKDPKT